MMLQRLARLYGLAILSLAACGQAPPRPDPVTLPASARPEGLGDPARGAILAASFVFNQPATVAGDPAAVAEALGRLEFLTVEIATGPRWIGMDPLLAPMLARGRAEARAAFGLDPAAPPQLAMDALFATTAALRAGDRPRAASALSPLTGPRQAEATLRSLERLPPLPAAATATARAERAMMQMDRGSRRLWPL
jgi:hypothetical protein